MIDYKFKQIKETKDGVEASIVFYEGDFVDELVELTGVTKQVYRRSKLLKTITRQFPVSTTIEATRLLTNRILGIESKLRKLVPINEQKE